MKSVVPIKKSSYKKKTEPMYFMDTHTRTGGGREKEYLSA